MTRKLSLSVLIAMLGLILVSRSPAQEVRTIGDEYFQPVSVEQDSEDQVDFIAYGLDTDGASNSKCHCCNDICWTGLYIGGHGSWASADVRYSAGSLSPPGTGVNDFDANGFLSGGLVGYNVQRGRMVYGLEADISSGNFQGGNPPPTPTVLDYDIKQLSTLRGRMGIARDRWLLFGTAGVGYATTETTEPSGVSEKDHVGFVVGTGLEWAWTEHLRLRGEYLFGTYSNERYDLQAPAHSHTGGPDTHLARWAVIWGF